MNIKSSKRFEEEILGDMSLTKQYLILENWKEFLEYIYINYQRPQESKGKCLSRLRKNWKRNPGIFRAMVEDFWDDSWDSI